MGGGPGNLLEERAPRSRPCASRSSRGEESEDAGKLDMEAIKREARRKAGLDRLDLLSSAPGARGINSE